MLAFAGDSVLIAYQDFLVASENRQNVVAALFETVASLTQESHDMLFLGNIPEYSLNLPLLRDQLRRYLRNGWSGGESVNCQRGGVQPWTIASLLNQCQKLRASLSLNHVVQPNLAELIFKLEKLKPEMLLFPMTRHALEDKLKEILARVQEEKGAESECAAIVKLLNPSVIPYPFLRLPLMAGVKVILRDVIPS
jgi:hypothetical protein